MHKVPTFVGNRGHALDEHLIKAVWKEIESLEVKSKQIKTIVTHIRHLPSAIIRQLIQQRTESHSSCRCRCISGRCRCRSGRIWIDKLSKVLVFKLNHKDRAVITVESQEASAGPNFGDS